MSKRKRERLKILKRENPYTIQADTIHDVEDFEYSAQNNLFPLVISGSFNEDTINLLGNTYYLFSSGPEDYALLDVYSFLISHPGPTHFFTAERRDLTVDKIFIAGSQVSLLADNSEGDKEKIRIDECVSDIISKYSNHHNKEFYQRTLTKTNNHS